jgi:hypothetical protein
MSLHDLSLKTLASIIKAAGVIIVLAMPEFQARNLFAPSITENVIAVVTRLLLLQLMLERQNRQLVACFL